MAFSLPKDSRDLSLVICAEAGQGLATLETLLLRSLKLSGYNVFATKEYMSRVRGGSNSTQIRISPRKVHAPVDRIDLLVSLAGPGAERLKERISTDTLIIGDGEFVSEELRSRCGAFIESPFAKYARELGKTLYANQIAAGVIARLLDIEISIIKKELSIKFSSKGTEIIEANTRALNSGYQLGASLIKEGKVTLRIKKAKKISKEIIVSGAEAVGLGAIAGGCDFIAAYPMSPSTGVFTFLAGHAKEFGIVAEQCEDEIAGINMALGAWYAGSRALASSSGGGFALMEEGVSLAAMIESPVVIHIAQRPGPATGLPTRTEQGDLELALYSGHGEFPRIILAPGSASEAFKLTGLAFNLADHYQIPVFILTDQYLIDSVVSTAPLDPKRIKNKTHITKTKTGYKRYAFTKTGLSPRGIPGFGTGFVSVDSDEHDEDGRITEDMSVRVQMVDKRLKKIELVRKESVPPTLIGNKNGDTVILGWGSTLEIIREALGKIKSPDVLFLHCSQPYPLHPLAIKYIKAAKKLAVIEGNATGQFARLIKRETGREADSKILKYNGLQFSVEEIAEMIGEFL